MKKISIACDHAGFIAKPVVLAFLEERGYEVLDFGTDSEDSVDYPDFIHPAMCALEEGKAEMGVVMCGSGQGAAMTANKHRGVRAALCWTPELAALARQHNDANVLAIPARFVSDETVRKMLTVFFSEEFEGGRHARRVKKIGEGCGT